MRGVLWMKFRGGIEIRWKGDLDLVFCFYE
jgi:hypothetical protein